MAIRFSTLACCLALFFITATSQSETTIPSIIGENMVLQRNQPIVIWGWDNAQQKIEVSVAGNSAQTTTDSDGKWIVSLDKLAAGGPHTITINGSSKISLKNVLVGEVWLCSGQSNMEWSANAGIDNKEVEIANAHYPNIRLFTVAKRAAYIK